MTERRQGASTRALTAWRELDEVLRSRPLAPPLYQTATFGFEDMEHFAGVAKSKIDGGYLYTRWANPTVDAVARVIASLEGADATACFASGMGAITGAVTAFAAAGSHVVSASQLYGGTHGLYSTVFPRYGIDVTQADVSDLGAIERAFTDRTSVLYCETLGNPTLPVADLPALAELAHARDARLIVDATFTPPAILRPLEHGADVVVHSATKYLSGHADVTAGVVSGTAADIAHIRHLQLETGAILAPFEAWLLGRGLQTLALRVERICENALALARALEAHARVERVFYPGLPSHPDHERARRLLGGRFGGMLAFEVTGGVPAGRRILERVRVAVPAASLGGTKTLIVHPASITHTQLTEAERAAVGVTDGMIRVSVGIEDIEDLIADFDEALS